MTVKRFATLREAFEVLYESDENHFIAEILEFEEPQTPVYLDAHDTLRFVIDPATEMLHSDLDMLNLNTLAERWYDAFGDSPLNYKNDPRYRILMQRIGYSVFGYWELTRWEANNPNYEQYVDNSSNEII